MTLRGVVVYHLLTVYGLLHHWLLSHHRLLSHHWLLSHHRLGHHWLLSHHRLDHHWLLSHHWLDHHWLLPHHWLLSHYWLLHRLAHHGLLKMHILWVHLRWIHILLTLHLLGCWHHCGLRHVNHRGIRRIYQSELVDEIRSTEVILQLFLGPVGPNRLQSTSIDSVKLRTTTFCEPNWETNFAWQGVKEW